MRRVKITLPATITNIGPALGGVALAVSLHTTVEFSERDDHQLQVKTANESSEPFPPLEHPAVLAAMRVFQHTERTLPGLNIRVQNGIPIDSGLGAEAALAAAGAIGANNLLEAGLKRETLMALAAYDDNIDAVAGCMIGGLSSGIRHQQRVIVRNLPITPMELVVVVPTIKRYASRAERALNKTLDTDAVRSNLSRVPLLINALDRGDFAALPPLMDDDLLTPSLVKYLTGYKAAHRAALDNGASAVTVSGNGPALVAFTQHQHQAIADAMCAAFTEENIDSRAWVLPIDHQGLVISMTGTR